MAATLPRLKRRAEFLRVARAGAKWVAPGLILQVRPHRSGERHVGADRPLRVGFTVSRKVGNAVKRNRARRRLKAAAVEVLSLHARQSHDYVIIGRAATLGRDYACLVQDLRWCLKRLGVFRHAPPGEKPVQGVLEGKGT